MARITARRPVAGESATVPKGPGRARSASRLAAALVAVVLAARPGAAVAGQRAELRLELPGPGAAVTASSGEATGFDRLLAAELADRAPGLAFSPRLARAAEVLAGAVDAPDASALPIPFIESALHWAGAPHLSPRVTLMATSEDSRTDLWREVAARLGADPPSAETEIGIGRVPSDGKPFRWHWAFVLAELKIDLEAVPRRLASGDSVALSFALRSGRDGPRIVVTSVGGSQVRRTPVRSRDRWTASLQMGLEPGAQWIEILAAGRSGPEVVALFPVWVGREPPHQWQGWAGPDESWIAEPWQAELVLLELVNDQRRATGLGPLVADAHLVGIARRHSEDMLERGYFAHVAPDGADLADRLRRAGVEVSRSAENIARSPTVHEAHASLMRSPGHAANVLTTDMDRIGIGVAIGRDRDGQRIVLVTQVFAQRRGTKPGPG